MSTNKTDPMRKLETLQELALRGATAGERAAAKAGVERLRARLAAGEGEVVREEFTFSFSDPWSQQLFVAMCRRRGHNPAAGATDREVVLVLDPVYASEDLWPSYERAAARLDDELTATTNRFVKNGL